MYVFTSNEYVYYYHDKLQNTTTTTHKQKKEQRHEYCLICVLPPFCER